MIQASRLPIVLCCAEESEVALVAVVDALHREGHAPEVVPGVETDATLLSSATDRVRGPALFVLCQSDDLDRFQVRRLEGLFSARKGPAHRMITVEVARRSTAAIVTEVRAAARDVGRGMGGRDDDDGSYMRDVVIPTSVAAVPGASVPARGADRSAGRGPAVRGRSAGMAGPPSAIVQAPEGISDEALGLDSGSGESDTEVVDPFELHRSARLPEPDVQLATDPAARAALEAAGWATDDRPSDGVPLAVPDDFPVVGESSQDVEVRGAPRRASWAESGPVEVERVVRRAKVDPRAESDDRPLPSASSPIDIGRPPQAPDEPRPQERKGARLFLLLFAGAGMGAVITMAVLHATAPAGTRPVDVPERGVPHPAITEPAPAKAVEPAPAKVEPQPVPAVVPAAASAGLPGAGEGTTGAAEDTGGEGGSADRGEASTGPDAGAAEAAMAAEGRGAEPGEADDGGEVGPPEGPTKLVPPPPSPGAAADGGLAAAIAEGRVRELDTLLMVNTGPSTVTWDEAASRCSRRKVGGVGNWRLPTKGQLGELRRGKLLGPGTYWSRSTVGEDEAFVVDAGSGQASQWLKMEPNGRVVCVRPRP